MRWFYFYPSNRSLRLIRPLAMKQKQQNLVVYKDCQTRFSCFLFGLSSNQITSILGRASMFLWLNCRCSSVYAATLSPKESLSLLIILLPLRCSSLSEIFSSSHVSFKERMWSLYSLQNKGSQSSLLCKLWIFR